MSVCSVSFTWGLFIMINWICFVNLTLEFYFSLTISLCPYASAFARSPGVLKFIGMKVLKVKNGMFLLVFHRLFVDGVVIVVLWKSFVMLGSRVAGRKRVYCGWRISILFLLRISFFFVEFVLLPGKLPFTLVKVVLSFFVRVNAPLCFS